MMMMIRKMIKMIIKSLDQDPALLAHPVLPVDPDQGQDRRKMIDAVGQGQGNRVYR